ncbi:MAG: potassium-transporting ATPase subunit KdpC [Gammaproteobacteria bacterium]
MYKQLKTSLSLLLLLTTLTGIIYPAIVTGIAQLFFPLQANGSLVALNGKVIGSALLGQSFDAPHYFWGRPSATTPYPYNASNSSGSNMGPSNPDYLKTVQERVDHLHQNAGNTALTIPADLVTASGSGLDPDISHLAALYQVPRIAQETHLPEEKIETLIQQHLKTRTLGILGEPRVNVLELNIALDTLRSSHDRTAP